jgi:pyochelin synthetase
MDELNGAVRSAHSGDDRGRGVLERAMSEELGASATPAATSAAIMRRLRGIKEARALMKRETTGQGDNVKSLAELDPNDATVWVMLRLADRITEQLRAAREAGSDEALVVGIVGSVGSGKSTLVQVLKLLLRSECCTGKAAAPPRCEEVSIDDFLTSQKERAELGIANRWELNSTAEYFAESVLEKLKTVGSEGSVDVPCFSKADDERLDTVRTVRGPVDIVLFEGWRIGVAHPNFYPFNRVVDTLMFIDVDFKAIMAMKLEAVQRGIDDSGKNMYEKHGGYEYVFKQHYLRTYDKWIEPVKSFADVVISKDAGHQFCKLEIHEGRWPAARDAMQVEDTGTVIVGAGQAGLCAAHYLQQAGSRYVMLEKAEAVGTTWTRQRWDSFRLVTENSLCMMPDFPCTEIGEDPRGFMPRGTITAYLQAFCKRKNLQVRLGEGAKAVTKGWNGAWVVYTEQGNWIRSQSVVMACSGFHLPSSPPFSRDLPAQIKQVHSGQYKNPEQLPKGAVMVVGTGQSGTQIAAELAESGRRVFACVGSRSLRVPRRVRGKDFNWWLYKTGKYDTKIADLSPAAQQASRFGPNPSQCPQRDVRLRELCNKHDLTLLGKAMAVTDGDILQLEGAKLPLNMTKIEANVMRMKLEIEQYVQQHADDPELQDLEPLELEPYVPLPKCETDPIQELSLTGEGITTIIWCTGYKLNYQALVDLSDLYGARGYPIQERGAATNHPGLFFLSLHWMYKWKSSILCGIAEDAKHVVDCITKRAVDLARRETVPQGIEGRAADGDTLGKVPKVLAVPSDQLTAHEAWKQTWQSHYDLLPDTDRVFLREVNSRRRPLDYARLKSFIGEDLNLHDFGIGQGDRLCVVIPNGPEAAVCFMGMSLQCTYAPLSTKLTRAALKFEFVDLPATAVVVFAGLPDSDDILTVAASCGNLPIIEMFPSVDDVGLFTLQWRKGSKQLLPLSTGRVWPKREDVALVLHTSGTTNKPKVVPLTHGNISTGGLCIMSTLGLTPDDVCINIMPLFHIHGISVNVLVTALSGASVYATTGFTDGAGFFDALRQSPPPTWYSAVPTMHQEILNFAEKHQSRNGGAAPKHHLLFARNCSAALLPSVGKRMENVLGLQVICTYAMTESMPIASNPRRGGRRDLRSVGFSGGPEILVMKDPEKNKNLEICGPNEEGHICVRGECVTHGYEYHKSHMKVDPNIQAFTKDNFLCTGDKGYVDSNGHLVISGRFKEIINRGGEKISPMEVEDVLMTHAAIDNMICFAAPHEQLGEVVGAAVVLHKGETLELVQLRSFASKKGVAQQWLPETMVTMNDIPKGMTGKPARIKLAEKLQLPKIKLGDARKCWDAFVSPTGVLPASLSKPRAAKDHPPLLQLPLALNRESWESVLLAYLMPALMSEAATILGLPREDMSDEIPLCNLSFDSLSLKYFREKIYSVLGVRVPLGDLADHSLASLTKFFISGGLSTGGSTDVQLPDGHGAEQENVDEKAKFDLLPMQLLYWTGRARDVPQPAWIEWETVMPELDKVRFEAAVNELMIRHGALRTFALPGDPKQQIEPPQSGGKFKLVIHSALETDEAIGEHRQALLSKFEGSSNSFQIEALRIDANAAFRIFFLFDLLVADARALTVLMDELWALYSNAEAKLPVMALTMPLYVALVQRQQQDVVQKQKEENFWAKLCDQEPEDGGLHPHPQLPLATEPEHGDISRLSSSIGEDKWKRIMNLCRAEGLTPSSLLFACYCSILATWSSSKKFTMNCALFGRDTDLHAEAGNLVGNLSSTLLVPVDASKKAAPSLRVLAKTLHKTVLSAMDHSVCTSGTETMSRLNNRDGSLHRAVAPFVFASVLNQHPADLDNPFTWFGKTPEHGALTTPQVWIDVQVFDDVDGSLYFNWDAHLERFPEGLVETMFHAFSNLLEELATDSQLALASRPVRPPEPKQRVHDLNKAALRPALQPTLMHEAILKQAMATPDATAVCDGSTGESFTFKKVVRLARSFAAAIVETENSDGLYKEKSAKRNLPGRPVAVYMKKGWQQVVGCLAAQLAGCPYVPISANQPPERIAGILADIKALVLLHDGRVETDALNLSTTCDGSLSAVRIILVAEESPEAHFLPGVDDEAGQVQLSDLAYIIFTSGSTGKPKGVKIPHSGGSNTCIDMNERFGVTAKDKVLSLAALSFDLSVYDIFGVMATGGTLVMPDHRLKGDPAHWLDLLEKHQVTIWNTAPPVMTMMLDFVGSSNEVRERFRCLPLRLVLLSGDFIPLTMASTLKELLSTEGLSIISLGGATEASIWSCWYPIGDICSEWTSIPYGSALGNQKMFVLDTETLEPVPDLVSGEICIGGDGLACGYWGDVEKTKKAFVQCEALGGELIYRTGDLGRLYSDGNIEILGRTDFQIKINGFRVEIGEVEAAINAVDSVVKSSLCMPVGKKGAQQLVAFVVCVDTDAPTVEAKKALVLDAVQEGLKSRVAYYMVPQYIVLLPEFPVSVSGKVDRQALKKLGAHLEEQQLQSTTGLQHVEPRNDTETRLREIWEAVLGKGGFGVMEAFSKILGGSSIKLLQMRYKVKDAFGQRVPLEVLQKHDSIAALATWLQRDDSVSESTSSFNTVAVLYNETGCLPPLFFVAPVTGESLCYKKLADILGAEQPIIALSHTHVCRDVEQASLESIAADLVGAVLEHLDTLPEGRKDKFSLGGWSMGGVLAVEMLLQLRRQGKSLASVILVDSPAPVEGTTVLEDEAASLVQFAKDIVAHDERSSRLPLASSLSLSSAPRQDMLIALQRLSVLPKEQSLVEFSESFDVYQRNLRALAAYRPQLDSSNPERVVVHLLRGTDTNPHLQAYPGHSRRDFGWGMAGIPLSNLPIYLYEGDHYAVVRDSGARAIGRIMQRLLQTAARPSRQSARTNFHFVRTVKGLSRTLSSSSPRNSAPLRSLRDKMDDFCVCTGTSKGFEDDSAKCAQDAYGEFVSRSGRMPQLILVTADSTLDAKAVVGSLQLMAPDARIACVSSVPQVGALTNRGVSRLALLGIADPQGTIGLGFAEGASTQRSAREAGCEAANMAMSDAKRADNPDVIIVNGTFGFEEEILAGIATVVNNVPVIGGSAAGDLATHGWWVASAHRERVDVSNDGVSVVMLWTSVHTATIFSSCYEPTACRGIVTKKAHREILEIDGKPASDVYREWLLTSEDAAANANKADQSHVDELCTLMQGEAASIGNKLFQLSTMRPLGSRCDDDFFQLMHPESITSSNGIRLFADVATGQELTLMTTSSTDLVELVEAATEAPAVGEFCEKLQGALAFYCAGCSLQIRDQIDDVAKNLSTSLQGQPFMGILPYGEQGTDGRGSVHHGNLMYSLLLFGKSKQRLSVGSVRVRDARGRQW